MSAHLIALPHSADTQTDAEVPPVSVNEDTVAHQVVNGDTVAHHGAERGQVGVEAYGDSQSQSHTAQQVCSIFSLSVSVAQCFHCMRFQTCCGDRVWCGAYACVPFLIPAGLLFGHTLLH